MTNLFDIRPSHSIKSLTEYTTKMKRYRQFLFLFLLDGFLLNISFFTVNYLKRGTLNLAPVYYLKLLIAFNIIWLTVSLVLKRYNSKTYTGRLLGGIKVLIKSAVFTCYIVSFMVVLMGLFAFSRLHILGTIFLTLFFEIMIYFAFYIRLYKQNSILEKDKTIDEIKQQRISSRLLIADFLLLNLSLFFVNYLKINSILPIPGYEMMMLVLYGIWLLTSLTTRKFDKDGVYGFINAFVSIVKSVILMAVILALLVFFFRLHYFSREQLFGTLILYFFMEILLYGFYVINKLEQLRKKDVESIEQIKSYLERNLQDATIEIADKCSIPEDPVQEKLRTALDFLNPWLFNFIHMNIDLSKVCKSRTCILNSEDNVNLNILNGHDLTLIINIYSLNNFRRVNQYFLEIHRKLEAGGYFVGKVNTIGTYRERVNEKYPKYISSILYALHFICFRMAPKLPITHQIYFAVTRGRNRILSKAEVLGRLHFCGFEVVAEQELEYELYFMARKTKKPSPVTNPSYGPIIKLKRFGLNGKPILVYKFRTMYSYSEFLQDYIHDRNSLQDGGKFDNDFRVTAWGKFMRKLWLDELPMLYNWIRGDLQLVGVRPLSFQYFSLYSKDLQRFRCRVKPGLIPPFFVDLPESFDEICESERRYIKSYLENPLRTQITYFGKALYNIIIRGARSN